MSEDSWKQDEWITKIFAEEWQAKRAVREFGEGRDFDYPSSENQITRYFDQDIDELTRGREVLCEVYGGSKEWMRYAKFEVEE